MKATILFFGQLTDVTGTGTLQVNDITDTASLTHHLHHVYPGLDSRKYVIAVNNDLIQENTILNDNATVALLPPFSGG